MNFAIILSGGVGVRLGGNIPKQYIEVNNRPIIGYCLDTFQRNNQIDKIVIVISDEWKEPITSYIIANQITKFISFASAGKSRQHSILNGLEACKTLGAEENDRVIIHDAARPNVDDDLINGCLSTLESYDNAMPVITVKDTVYYSEDGKNIKSLLNRDNIYAGQAPESCHFGSYYRINKSLSDDQLSAVRGTSAIAYENGLTVGLFKGKEHNYKITTMEDLNKFRLEKNA